MTRPIGAIFDDLIELRKKIETTSADMTLITVDGYKGDTHIIDSNLLLTMYETLFQLLDFLYKDTTGEIYAPSVMYVFDTHWWDFTGEQRDEFHDFYYNGYTYGNRRSDFSSFSYKMHNWPVDENSQFVKVEGCDWGNLIYNDMIKSIPDEMPKDKYRIEDLCNWNDGKFFDPSCVAIETQQELDDWLDVFDSILTIAKGLKPFQEFIIPTTTTPYASSDILEVSSEYVNHQWYDDLTDETGEMVEQHIFCENDQTGENIDFTVYSEDRTISVWVGDEPDPPYDPIYELFTYNTTDSETGLSFGATAEEIHAYCVLNFTETYTESYPVYGYRTQPLNGVEGYIDELYNRNMSDTIQFRDSEVIDKMSDEIGGNTTYTVANYTDYIERDDLWNQITKERWESDILFVTENEKDTSLAGNRFITEESILGMTYEFPEYGTEAFITYGRIFGGKYMFGTNLIKDVNLDKYTIHQLLPPE